MPVGLVACFAGCATLFISMQCLSTNVVSVVMAAWLVYERLRCVDLSAFAGEYGQVVERY